MKMFTMSPCMSLMVSTLLGGLAKKTLPPPTNGSTYVRCAGKSSTIFGASQFFEPYQVSGEGGVARLPQL